ncbi:MAG: type II toxin-antitoxin system VapC family toxin [Candidatus Lokiarchaeota archaeon]|nr:type II toxin-antitoxin system VapC family toxin [Candidatus Lokiarchaeota archaeon]
MNQSLIIKAGELKCKHRNVLSLVDCIAIGHAMNNKPEFHTTEKSNDELFPRLKASKYQF